MIEAMPERRGSGELRRAAGAWLDTVRDSAAAEPRAPGARLRRKGRPLTRVQRGFFAMAAMTVVGFLWVAVMGSGG
ncbi:hypothetical protein L6Q21_09535 [Sandaracinobacter sp. RS1-74]|uniref:hypothetical protein n=1 Tax=Sandaracinobacteroides sayramensis TaxID=2913411 RepID=UPI001EDBC6B3|nr:hypothetical protein [Sandaracinobacteroides sayramensis]MCG2841220.1 hypothetical protein [Sandaracinobacteroides sayramensis]